MNYVLSMVISLWNVEASLILYILINVFYARPIDCFIKYAQGKVQKRVKWWEERNSLTIGKDIREDTQVCEAHHYIIREMFLPVNFDS
ncbi:MAG: hypothetical protein H0U76_30510 [Ktedonobacteraceae bacterium]|nr:hypothetical protein [Ktedonobacteraceae bacterium]